MSTKAKRAHPSDYYASATLYVVNLDTDQTYGCVIATIYRCHLTKRCETSKSWGSYRSRSVALHRVSDAYMDVTNDVLYYQTDKLGQEGVRDTEQIFTTLAAAQRFAISVITEVHGIGRPHGLNLTDSLIKMMAEALSKRSREERAFISHLVTQDAIHDLLADVPAGTAGESVQNNSVSDKLW